MKIFELFEDLNWAVGDNIDKSLYGYRQKSEDRVIFWVNIKELMDNADPDFALDLNDPTGGKNKIGDRVNRAKEHWGKNEFMDPSEIGYNNHYNTIGFGDGRHRLVAAYQLGHQYAPVTMLKDDVPKIGKLIKLYKNNPSSVIQTT